MELPKANKSSYFKKRTFTISPEMDVILLAIADKYNTTISEVIRVALKNYDEQLKKGE